MPLKFRSFPPYTIVRPSIQQVGRWRPREIFMIPSSISGEATGGLVFLIFVFVFACVIRVIMKNVPTRFLKDFDVFSKNPRRNLARMMAFGVALLLSSMASGDEPGFQNIFKPLPEASYITKPGSTLLVKNMPPVYSQGGLGICHGYSSAAVLQQYLCEQDNWDCQHLPDKNTISPLGMSTFSRPSDVSKKVNDFERYEGIDARKGGSGAVDLINGGMVGMVYSNACYNFDKFMKVHSGDEALIFKQFGHLEDSYKLAHRDLKKACIDCLAAEIEDRFNRKVTPENIKKALDKKTFEEFLYVIFFWDCDQVVELVPRPDTTIFPESRRSDYDTVIAKIREVLSSGKPINLDSICFSGDPLNCTEGHSVVISGYRVMCLASGGDCRDALQIHNSWGQEWQDAYEGGWVDAKTLLDTTGYQPGILSWLKVINWAEYHAHQ
jgi:hypothetical protein